MSDPEIYRRLGTVEEDTRKLYGAMSELTTEIKLISQATHTMQKTLEAMNSINSTMHDHDKRLINNSSQIENLTKRMDEIGNLDDQVSDLDKRVTSNESVTGLVKWLASSIVLSAIGLSMTAIFGQ